GVSALVAAGATVFLEVGPSETLSKMGAYVAPKGIASFVPSLRKGKSDRETIAHAAARLFAQGVEIEAPRGRRAPPPTYPFQRRRYWLASEATRAPIAAISAPSLRAAIRAEVTDLLGRAPDDARGFFEQGLDSLGALALHERLQRVVGLDVALPPTMVF